MRDQNSTCLAASEARVWKPAAHQKEAVRVSVLVLLLLFVGLCGVIGLLCLSFLIGGMRY